MNKPRVCSIEVSKHALARLRQRGLSHEVVPLVMEYGDRYYAGSGKIGYVYGARAAIRARKQFHQAPNDLNIAIVVSHGNLVVTAFHIHRRIPRHWRRSK